MKKKIVCNTSWTQFLSRNPQRESGSGMAGTKLYRLLQFPENGSSQLHHVHLAGAPPADFPAGGDE